MFEKSRFGEDPLSTYSASLLLKIKHLTSLLHIEKKAIGVASGTAPGGTRLALIVGSEELRLTRWHRRSSKEYVNESEFIGPRNSGFFIDVGLRFEYLLQPRIY